MMLPEVKLEVWLPDSRRIAVPAEITYGLFPHHRFSGDIEIETPRVWKMALTEASEVEIFGDVSPYRTSPLPPLPWGNEQFYEKKLAMVDEEQAGIYNKFIQRIYDPELISIKQITAGIVEVFRAAYNVQLFCA